MDFLRVFITAPFSIITLFFLSKMIGNKQISNMNIFDYINGITIGSIAAEMAICRFEDLPDIAIALFVYAGVVVALTVISQKSIRLRRFFTGKTIVLYDRGKLYKKNLSTAKIDFNEMLAMLRNKGYFSLEDIETVLFEQSGNISVLPKEKKRPVNPDDLKLVVHQQRPEIMVVLNGKILRQNLAATGNNEQWLKLRLEEQNKKLGDIFAAVCDGNNTLKIIECNVENPINDLFE